MANSQLHAAKNAKNDEFYTQYEDIEREINAYVEYNKGRLKYLMNKNKAENSNRVNDNSNKSNNIILGTIFLTGLKSLFSLVDKKETPNYSKYTNEEINNSNLEDW